jgi:threonine/homoserine/homoserine lactone efflux protein
MRIVLPLALGTVISLLGTLLPGLLNMTAARISLRDGRKRAVIYCLGAVTVIFFQMYIAVSFVKFINQNPDIIDMLQEVGIAIFGLLTIYFLFIAKKPITKQEEEAVSIKSKTGRYFLGVLLSALNFFPIPFYVFISITLGTYGYFDFTDPLFVALFVLGGVLGSFAMLYLYVVFFKNFKDNLGFITRNINYIIGGVTGLVAVITLIRLLKES